MSSTARYKAERRLARGLVTEVLLGKDTQRGNSPVVVKRLLPDLALDRELRALFEREVQIARSLQHPNIVEILDVVPGATPFYVMPHLVGADLRDVMLALRKRGEKMPARTACAIGAAVAHALSHAHDRGALHRDIKPGNIFLSSKEGGRVTVLDFGIATSTEHVERLTRTGTARGTRAYMAPEQQAGLALDGRTDVFALGVVMWETLTSRRLFKRDTDEDIARAIRDEPAPLPSSVGGVAVPSRVEAIVMSALGKLPATRPPASIMASVLEAEAATGGDVASLVRDLRLQ